MKKILSIMAMILLAAAGAIGQSPAPGIFNYQGVARNSVGNVLINKTITLRLTVHDGTAVGPTVYQESRTVTTNPFGLFNVQVGSPGATSVTGTIAGVNWGVGNKYIQVEIDPNGGTTFINIGTAQIASVPYSLYSSLANDLVLPFNKTQSDAGTLFKVTNSGTGAASGALEGITNSTAGNVFAIRGTVSSTSPGGFSTAVRGINNGTGGLGIGVWGSQAGSGWGVLGEAPNGIGVYGSALGNGTGVNGYSDNGIGVAGFSNLNGRAAVFAIQSAGASSNANNVLTASTVGLGTVGSFTNTNAANTAPTLSATTNGTSGNIAAVLGTISSTTPGGFSAAVRGVNNGTGGLGIGVWGSQNGSGWGVYGQTPSGIGVYGLSTSGFGVYGQSTSGVSVYGIQPSNGTNSAGYFQNTNAANTAPTLSATTNGTSGNHFAIQGEISSNSPGGFSAGVRGVNNGTGGLGIGVWGSQAGSGWGVYGTANGGIGVNGSANSGIGVNGASNSGTGGRFTTSSGLALHSTGGVRLEGIGEALNRILTSDAAGNATWQAAAAVGVVTGSGTLNFVPKWTPSGTNLGNSLLFDDGNSVGLGTTTPTHRFTVQHTGSTGISVSSTSGFSVLDINAASGDAAIRFGNAGVNQWNVRNRPGDDYFEIFELGGGGSRVVIQDGTGNLGVGETTNPTYKLDVLHGGSTGIRSRSSGSFSVVDIDAASGDAALRFAKAGVNQWNIRNRPADDYLEIFELGGGGSRVVIQDGTGNVGIGETTSPSYRLDVLHGGSTGIRSRSSGSFSVVDIDAASGDAALRFANAGVNQWNIRNRPADDYLEIFELGGGGSRVVIQDGTGNVGIGETTSPSYKLDVLHGGATGARIRSSATFSVVDIDAANGDAALRFAKAGVNQWNIRNRPADDYLEIFELGGGGSRVVIQDATGNVGIGETTAPSHKLHVQHGGATGIRSESTASFSVVDIDGFNGDAALRFFSQGTSGAAFRWVTRNAPGTNNYEIYGNNGSTLFTDINYTTGELTVYNDFTALGVKAFTMDHPLDPANKTLKHAAAESNEVINFYSGNITTDNNGKAVVQLPDYFGAINKDPRYQLTVIGSFAQAIISKEVNNNQFEISTNQPNVKVSWEVKGVRNDAHMQKQPFVAVQEKPANQKGRYLDPAAHNQPLSKGRNYDASMESSITHKEVPAQVKIAPPTTGGSLDQQPIVPLVSKPIDKSGSVEDVKVEKKAEVKPAETKGTSVEDVKPADKKAEVKPVDTKGTSVEDKKPVDNKKPVEEKKTENSSVSEKTKTE